MKYLGNIGILNNHKVGFLCSRRCPAAVVLKSYDWAKEQREAGTTVVCGNHSQIEKDVFEILLRGKQPLVLVLARSMMKRWGPVIEIAVKQNRLLVISPFDKKTNRVTRENAKIRNQSVIEISDELVVGFASDGGMLSTLLKNRVYESLTN